MPLDAKTKHSAIILGVLAAAVLGVVVILLVNPRGTPPQPVVSTQPETPAAPPPAPVAAITPDAPAPPARSADGITPALEADRAAQEAAAPATAPAGSALLTEFDGGLRAPVTRISDTHFALTLATRYEYMFYIRLTGVRGKTVRIDINNIYSAGKWSTLNPVYRDANADTKILLQRATADADIANMKTFPAINGAQLPDTTGLPWHFIPNVWTTGPNAVSFVHTFEQDDVYVAMKTPFNLTDYAGLVDDAKTQPGVQVIELGTSPAKNTVRIIKVSSGDDTEKTNPTLVFYAREFADENDASWVAAGALQRLLRPDAATQELRKHFTYFFIPVLDLDGAAKSTHQGDGFSFSTQSTGSPQSILYAKFFSEWVKGGGRIDLLSSLHNVESKEAGQLSCPVIADSGAARRRMEALFATIVEGANSAGFVATPAPWQYRPITSMTSGRLSGWLTTYFGPVYLPLEANSQDQHRHLNATELKSMGGQIVLSASQFLTQPQAESSLKAAADMHQAYLDRWKKYGSDIKETNPFRAERDCLERDIISTLLEEYLKGGPVAAAAASSPAAHELIDTQSDAHLPECVAQALMIPDTGVDIAPLMADAARKASSDPATKAASLKKLVAGLLAGPHPAVLTDHYFSLLELSNDPEGPADLYIQPLESQGVADQMWKLASAARAADPKQSIELARASIMCAALGDFRYIPITLIPTVLTNPDDAKKLLALPDAQFDQLAKIVQTRLKRMSLTQGGLSEAETLWDAAVAANSVTPEAIAAILAACDKAFRQDTSFPPYRFDVIRRLWTISGQLKSKQNEAGQAAVRKELEALKHDFPDPNIERWGTQALTREVTPPRVAPTTPSPAVPSNLP